MKIADMKASRLRAPRRARRCKFVFRKMKVMRRGAPFREGHPHIRMVTYYLDL